MDYVKNISLLYFGRRKVHFTLDTDSVQVNTLVTAVIRDFFNLFRIFKLTKSFSVMCFFCVREQRIAPQLFDSVLLISQSELKALC